MTRFVGPEFVTLVRNIKDRPPSVRTVITTEDGAHRSGRTLLPCAMRKAAMLNQSYGLSVAMAAGRGPAEVWRPSPPPPRPALGSSLRRVPLLSGRTRPGRSPRLHR